MNNTLGLWFKKHGKVHANKKYNRYDLSGEFGIGYTSKGEEFYFDLEDFEKIKNICWSISRENGIIKHVEGYDTEETRKNVLLHKYILGLDKKVEIDHIDRNPLNNKKYNLRPCTHKQNIANASIKSNNKWGVTGIYRYIIRGRVAGWRAQIENNGVSYHLGTFVLFEDAVKARLNAEKEIFGEFAPQKHLYEQYNII